MPRYLYEQGCCAIAHAYAVPVVDPDDVADLRSKIRRLTEAVMVGGDLASLVAEMKAQERRRAEVMSGLATLDRVAAMGSPELAALHDALQAHLSDSHGLLRAAPVQGRQILRKLLVGRVTFTPRTERTER